MIPVPYWSDETCALYLGDCREVLPALGVTADCIIADPPYGETSLEWDRWPDGWVEAAAKAARSMWCFGSMRMFLEHADEFSGSRWKLSQDVIWEKANGTSFATDRFKRVHENVTHWYQGRWDAVYHETPRTDYHGPDKHVRMRYATRGPHVGEIGMAGYEDDGTRLTRSVLFARSVRGGLHRKPVPILLPLIEYACRPGGLVADLFTGSGSVLDAARLSGRRAVGFELYEPHAEQAARRLSQMVLEAPAGQEAS